MTPIQHFCLRSRWYWRIMATLWVIALICLAVISGAVALFH